MKGRCKQGYRIFLQGEGRWGISIGFQNGKDSMGGMTKATATHEDQENPKHESSGRGNRREVFDETPSGKNQTSIKNHRTALNHKKNSVTTEEKKSKGGTIWGGRQQSGKVTPR